jgi:GWxTD domain-containing protein
MQPGCWRGWARRSLIPIAIGGLGVSGQLQALQAPEARRELQQFRETIAGLDDVAILRRVEHGLDVDAGPPEAQALSRLQRGYLRLRQVAAGDERASGRAAGDFRQAARLQPDWSETWLALGRARRAEGDQDASDLRNLGKRIGFGAYEAAIDAYAEALRREPANSEALQALYATTELIHDTARMADIALPCLRAGVAAGADDPMVLLALGRSERLVGDPAHAHQVLHRFLQRGGEPGVGYREAAWSAFVAGDSDGATDYFIGAAEDDSASVAGYREDIAPIADEAELASFDAARGPARAELLRRFWRERDHRALRQEGERLAEHYRRLSYAERRFGLQVNRRHFSLGDMVRTGSTRFDDRGVVYVRYGEPDDTVSSMAFNLQPNQTWRYRRADGDLLLHFAANVGGDIQDYRLVPSVLGIGGIEGWGGYGTGTMEIVLDDRCPLYQGYCKLAGAGRFGRARILREEAAIVMASVSQALQTDDYLLHFARDLDAEVSTASAGRDVGRTLVHLAWRIPVTVPAMVQDPRLSVRMRLTVSDSLGNARWWRDTLLVAPIRVAGDGGWQAFGQLALPLPPGSWSYRLGLSVADSIGQVLPMAKLVVPDFDRPGLILSDLILGASGDGAPWARATGDTAYFTPRISWSPAETPTLYHEIYGLEAGVEFRAALVVRRGRRAMLTTDYLGRSAGPVTLVSQTLSLVTLPPGHYTLELRVTDSAGQVATATRSLIIRK